MVHAKSRFSIFWVILLFCAFFVESLERRKNSEELFLSQLVDPATGKLDEDLADLLWISCEQDFIRLKEANEDLIPCITEEGPNWNCKTNSKECIKLPFPLKQTLLDCIQKNRNKFHVFGGGSSDGQHANGVNSLFLRHHIQRRNLLQSITTTPSPAIGLPSPSPSPSLSPSLSLAPAPSPDPMQVSSPEPATLSAASSPGVPFSPLVGGPPEIAEDSSVVPTPSPPVEPNNDNNNQRTIAIVVVVTAVVTFVVVAFFFLCCCRGRPGVRRTDERPLLSVSLSDYSVASSNRTFDFGNSVKEEKLGSQLFGNVVAHDGKGLSMASNAYVKPESLHASLEQTGSVGKLHGETFETLGKNTGLVPPPPGKIMSDLPLKPPPGRVDPLPPEPPTSLRRPPGQSGPPPPPAALPPRPKTSTNLTPSPPGPPPPPPPMAPGVKPGPRPPVPPGLAPPRPPPPAPFGSKVPRPPLGSKRPSGAASFEGANADVDADVSKAKLKPFFWDKVLANPDQSMVWHQIKSGSFQFDEEMIEALFGAGSGEKKKSEQKKVSTSQDTAAQFIQILDPKKAQNLSIMLRALNVTIEEVCDAINEGNELPVELLQNLLKMAPTTEEELKLRLYSGELSQLGPAERFLKALVGIPFAFKRLEALLFMCSLQEEVTNIKESFETLEVACKELRNSRLFLKLLEAVLKTGNRMNDGTFRGGAQAFKLDTLLKLSDVKGTDGKTTLLHFVVQEIVRSEGVRAARAARHSQSFSGVSVKTEDLLEEISTDTEEHFRSLGLQAVSHVSSELGNVKKAAAVDADILTGTVAKLGHSLLQTRDFLNKDMNNLEEDSGFCETLKSFVQNAEVDIMWLLEEEKRIMALVKSTGDYFHGNAGKDEGLRLFVIVRDFLIILDRVCKEVGEAQKRAAKSLKKEASTASTSSSPTDPRTHPSPDVRQRLFPAIAERRADNSSSSSDDET